MKWHSTRITIAAALLITLPCQVNSAHCDVESWNRALKLQTQLEQDYNFYATRFNQFLQMHLTQPFLYQEFSETELQGLWQSNNRAFHQQMQAQVEASLAVIEGITQERNQIQPLSQHALALHARWQAISQHCQRSGNQTNVITSWHYAQLNQALKEDIEALITKLDKIEQRYLQEIEALENAKPKPHR